MFQLAWPIAAAMLGETALGLVDTKLVGGLGAGALAAVGLGASVMWLFYSVLFGAMRGVKIQTAHALGEGRRQDVVVYGRVGALMGAGLGVLIALACRDFSPVLRAIGAAPDVVPHARDFLAAVTLGAPATGAMAALIQHRQAIGDARTPMIVGIAGNAFNALFAWAAIYGHLGLPALGVRGGGLATATTEVLEVIALILLFTRDARKHDASSEVRRATIASPPISPRAAARRIAELGVPTGLHFGAEALAFNAFVAVLATLPKEEIAAHQIALAVIRVSFLPGVAVSDAASVLVGRSLGARDIAAADAYAKSSLKIAVGFMAVWGVLFAVGGGTVARFFTHDPQTLAIAKSLLVVAAIFQVLDAVNIVLRGVLRGAKDVRVVAIIGVLVIWTFVPTSAYFFGKMLGYGAVGGWIGFIGETTFGALFLALRWKYGGWRKRYA